MPNSRCAASAGMKNRGVVHGETSSYASARIATTGAYAGTDVKRIGPRVRKTELMLRPLTREVPAAEAMSSTSATTALISVAVRSPPNPVLVAASTSVATRPATAPVMNRVLVYVAHLRRGARSGSDGARSSGSPSIDAALTTAPASGPKSTAANNVGNRAIDNCVVRVTHTPLRSATALTIASARTVHVSPRS